MPLTCINRIPQGKHAHNPAPGETDHRHAPKRLVRSDLAARNGVALLEDAFAVASRRDAIIDDQVFDDGIGGCAGAPKPEALANET